jgi:hypothetical protein
VFYQLYKQEIGTRIAKRWQVLWVLRRAERLKRVREVGGQPQADLAGSQGVEGDRSEGRDMGPCGFSQGEGGGRGATMVGSRGEGLIAGRVAPYPLSFECPVFMIEKLCI